MATPIPALSAQVVLTSSTSNVAVADAVGTPIGNHDMSTSIWYYLVSNAGAHGCTTSGSSLLAELKHALVTADAGGSWDVKLSTGYKVSLFQNAGAAQKVAFEGGLGALLGFASETVTCADNAWTTADYFSRFWWSPDMSISSTGPTLFDPAYNGGVPSSAGSSQWAPDMTGAHTSNAIQYVAQYVFRGVEFYYKIRHDQTNHPSHNDSWEEFWGENLRKGRRVLMWRSRDSAVGSTMPTCGAAAPYNYVEYQPTENARANMLAGPVTPDRLTHWDVTWDFWQTANGETPYTDGTFGEA